jgi:putative FmdB family regulatory protein
MKEMPVYEYKCMSCNKTKEVTRSITDLGEAVYCKCKSVMIRLYQPTAAIFKGKGWGKDK